jgi:gliding motility-associated-like protein
MKQFLRLLSLAMFTFMCGTAMAQVSSRGVRIEPFLNKVFIEERGQFSDKLKRQGIELDETILYGLENNEFEAYFTRSGVHFRFAERKVIPKTQRVRVDNEPEERGIETTWHSVGLRWIGSRADVIVQAEEKVHEYYNYTGLGGKPNINLVPAFDKLVYRDIYDGVDLIFELPDSGGIKYRFELSSGSLPAIAYEWTGIESLALDADGGLLIKSVMTLMKDHAPSAFTAHTGTAVPVYYQLNGNKVGIDVQADEAAISEGIVIDPWIVNTSFPTVNRAHDIQEDAAGNIVVHGDHTNYQVQKYSPAGVLQWTYITASIFLGDIAVDDPGNVYIIGGYSAGKRQKLDPAGIQQWSFAGLVEEWRLAFNYSKTVLTVGGYFLNPGGNNVARFDVSTGAISNQIVYGEETRGIATDCNGDMYSLHVTFGATGVAGSNLLRKTNADFTPAGSVVSGFLLAESEVTAGYAPNPAYDPYIFQGFNGLVVSGMYVYMTDGATVRRVNKTTLSILNSAPVPGGIMLMNSGLAADQCGNIYAGTLNGIVKFDSLLNYIQTIATPGAVYDIIYGSTGELLVCGDGFIGSYAIVCNPPPPITATANSACDGTGNISIAVAGGLAPYTYQWQPGGMTTNPVTGLPAGVYTYTVNDAFCRTHINSVEIFENPTPTFVATAVSSSNVNPASICLGESFHFSDNSSSNDGNIVSWEWDFGDGNTSVASSPDHTYLATGTYDVQLIVTTEYGCVDSLQNQVTVDPLPLVDFTSTDACLGTDNVFTDASSLSSGNIATWDWDFGDGATAVTQNPTHQYATSGQFTVELTATSANGCSDSFQSDVEVHALPQADFTFPSTCVNDPTDLVDATTVGDWPISSWLWDVEGQTLNGASVQHTFSAEGTFPVQLTVIDQFGCTDDVTQQVMISVRPNMEVSVNNDCEGEQFVFTNTSTIPSGTIAVTDWDMGDGNTYTIASPTNTYADFGTYTVALYLESDLGCASDTTFQVEVYPNPVAGLQWQNQCDGTPVVFNETSSVALPGQLLLSDWNMGDGTVLNDAVVTGHAYAGFGDYSVQLTVETQHGCIHSQSFPISVHAVPSADFSFANICETDSVLFNDQSSIAQGDIVDWQWDFGNGQTFVGQQPPYQTYPADGIFNVQLTVLSDSGCVSVMDDQIEIYPSPVANFMFDSVCFPLAVQFTDLSDPNGAYAIAQWAWNFSNGQSSLLQSPSIIFPQYGAYGATLTITNQVGCKDLITFGNALVHPVPVADYLANFEHCFLEDLVFSDESTLDVLSDDVLVSWNYDFDDGNSVITPNGTHQYSAAGIYDLELQVTSNHGCSDQVSYQVEVFPLPQVSFDADPKEGCDPLQVQFMDMSTISAPYSLAGWDWTTGDGYVQTSQNPYHIYDPVQLGPTDFATYDVQLIVTSGNGCKDSIAFSDLITVHPLPEALFSTDPEKLVTMVNPLFQLEDLSSINVTEWQWSFGDGTGSTVQDPEHAYSSTGSYDITLVVTTVFGCVDTISYKVIVEPYFSFYVPSAFTPNNDGINDSFFGSGESLLEYNMKIFDRWGELIFVSNSEDLSWDGTYKGLHVEAGQYVYRFDIVDWKGLGHTYTGGVQLLR